MKKHNLLFTGVLIAILVFSISINQFFFDKRDYLLKELWVRDLLEIGSVVITALLGFFYIRKSEMKTLRSLWILLYASSFFFLIVMAIIDNFFFTFSLGGQYRFTTLKSLLTGPVVFLVIAVFPKLIKLPAK